MAIPEKGRDDELTPRGFGEDRFSLRRLCSISLEKRQTQGGEGVQGPAVPSSSQIPDPGGEA